MIVDCSGMVVVSSIVGCEKPGVLHWLLGQQKEIYTLEKKQQALIVQM